MLCCRSRAKACIALRDPELRIKRNPQSVVARSTEFRCRRLCRVSTAGWLQSSTPHRQCSIDPQSAHDGTFHDTTDIVYDSARQFFLWREKNYAIYFWKLKASAVGWRWWIVNVCEHLDCRRDSSERKNKKIQRNCETFTNLWTKLRAHRQRQSPSWQMPPWDF